jgi:hypothetical protein
METIGRYLMLGGILLFVVGGLVALAVRFGLPLGHLPGDIRIEWKNGVFYFPLTTCILISVFLTILINLVLRIFKK